MVLGPRENSSRFEPVLAPAPGKEVQIMDFFDYSENLRTTSTIYMNLKNGPKSASEPGEGICCFDLGDQ